MRVILAGALMVASAAAWLGASNTPTQANRVSISSNRLLTLTAHRVNPDYPESALLAGIQGVVVAEVLVGEDGRMRTANLLQSPDAAIGDATRRALMQWRFEALLAPNGQPALIRSKIILYFTIRADKGMVLDPQEMARLRHAQDRTASRASALRPYAVISKGEWQKISARGQATLLDIRHRDAYARDHLEGAINIPEAELRTRGPAELSRSTPIVMDCPLSATSLCPYAVKILQDTGFTNVAVLKRD